MNRVISTFLELKTEEYLSESWVKKVWTDNGFSSYIAFPSEYEVFLEEVSISDVLNEYFDALNGWFQSAGISVQEATANYCESGENELTWQTLTREGIEYKSLVCILGTLILRFPKEPTNSDYFKDALASVRLYLFSVAIPGSHIYQIFNATLFSHAMSIVRTCCDQIDGTCPLKNKGTKRKANSEETEEDDEETETRLVSNKAELLALMNNVLNSFKLILMNRKFRMDESSLNLVMQILIMITKLEKANCALLASNLKNYRRDSVSYVAYKSFVVLLSMTRCLHSDPSVSGKLLIKELCSIFLLSESRMQGLNLKDGTIIRTNYTFFLKMLIEELGEHVYEAVNILVQRICVAAPDRAEMRLKATAVVMDILKVSPPELQVEQIYSIVFMSHMQETKTRTFTLELISKLLLESDTIRFEELPGTYAAIVNEEFLLAVIFFRCQDTAVGIRTKALSFLDQLVSGAKNSPKLKKLHDKIFVDPYVNGGDPETVLAYRKELFDTQQFILDGEGFEDDSISPLPGVKVILNMLVYFSQEDKVFIKKSSIQTLAKIFLRNRQWINKELLQVFLIGCDDSSVLIRKTVAQIMTDLVMMYPDHQDVISCWVEGVCPMIAEEEIKAQEKVIEHYCTVILNNIMLSNHTTSIVSRLPWLVMKEILRQKKRSYLHFATAKWIQCNILKGKVVQMIYSHVDTENNDIAWSLLASCAQFMTLPNADFIFEYYERICPTLDMVPHNQLVLETLYYVCSKMSTDKKKKLLNELEFNLLECRIPLKLIARSRDICELIVNDFTPDKNKLYGAVVDWSSPKIMNCLNYIESQIGKNSPLEVENESKLMKYIFLLGELAQPAPKCVSKSNIKLILNILIAPKKRESDMWKGRVSTVLKAVTILTLVKLSLQKEETASFLMPIFREILSSASVEPSIQVNAIIGMCDLCSRYTTLVERYFTYICKCFRSDYEIVRKTALVSVIKRIREEYVKLRPFIVFPMLTMILDKCSEIQRIIATFIGVDLKKKNNILETFYTGLFFFLNNCKNHATTVKIPDDIRAMFSYTDKASTRKYIYIYILDKLADTNRRLLVCKKIVNDIMASIADETLKLDEKTESILSDAFDVLIDNEKKISDAISKSKRGANEEGEEVEEAEGVSSQGGKKSQGVVVTESIRMNEITEMMPVIFKLKQHLKKSKSKCSKQLILYVCELMKNYKEEMSDLLTNDMEMKAEVDYQLRRLEVEQEELRRREEANGGGGSSSSQNAEHEADDGGAVLPEVNSHTIEEISEQLQCLIVELTRCDDQLPPPPLMPTVSGNAVATERGDSSVEAVDGEAEGEDEPHNKRAKSAKQRDSDGVSSEEEEMTEVTAEEVMEMSLVEERSLSMGEGSRGRRVTNESVHSDDTTEDEEEDE